MCTVLHHRDSSAHPRWEFVFQPKYAASLNLVELWWSILRSLTFTGKRFEIGLASTHRHDGLGHDAGFSITLVLAVVQSILNPH
jgi:hypothetical protein